MDSNMSPHETFVQYVKIMIAMFALGFFSIWAFEVIKLLRVIAHK